MLAPRVLGEKMSSSADEYELLKRNAVLDAREIALLKRENALMLAGGSVTAPASVVSDSGAAGIHLMNQRDNFWEASGGEWKSTKITRTFPKNWPLYKWPKK